MTGRHILVLALATIALEVSSIGVATAQTYPARPITVIVPFAAGGPTDTIARVVTQRMRASLGQPVIIENVGGAEGTLAIGRAARAAADGYTINIGNVATNVLNGAVYPLSYDLIRDFEPISLLTNAPAFIVANRAVPAKDLKELIAWLKANPDKVTAGTFATWGRLFGAYFQQTSGTHMQFVPYRGAAPAMQDLIAGHINLMFDQAANSLPQLNGGRIKAYAVAAHTRLALAPDIPTMDESGLPGFYLSVWHGLWAPKGTAKDIVARLNAAAVEALSDPDVRQRLAELGQDVPPRDQQTPEFLAQHQKAEAEKWGPIIKAANITGE
jgi:tripartite-type tricarboxylate transporter receptor subunit TctC